jgi:hypothetical protein
MHRVGIAHSMADVQDDPEDELLWDLRALAAADELTDQRVAEVGIDSPVAAFYPSLLLNLGEVYRKLGRLEEARDQLRRGLDATRALQWSAEPPDGYQAMVIDALTRLGERLDDASATGTWSLPSGWPTVGGSRRPAQPGSDNLGHVPFQHL